MTTEPTIMSDATRADLILVHTREAFDSDWPDAYARRCVEAVLAVSNGEDLTSLPIPDEDREIGDGPTAELDGLTDAEIVGMIIAYHWG